MLTPHGFMRRRRDRRMERNSNKEDEIRAWAEQCECSLRVLNDGYHWLFQKAGFMAEW